MLKTKALNTILKYNLIPQNTNEVLVGLSGGPDSVALTLFLNSVKQQFGFNLTAIHINHNLRGEEALRDQNFVIDFCKKLNIPLITESADVVLFAKTNKQSIELAARNLRYEFFKKYAKGLIATAHNANDNCETVILNLCRGTGLKGLCGIPPKRDNIIRPLIECTKAEIYDFLKTNGQDYVIDSTNLSCDYTRNKIRNNIVPLLNQLNSSAVKNISNTADNIFNDNFLLEEYINNQYYSVFKNNALTLNVSNFSKQLIYRIVYKFYYNYFNTAPDSKHIKSMCNVVLGNYKRTSVGNGFVFTLSSIGFVFEKTEKVKFINKNFGNNLYEGLKKFNAFSNVKLINFKDFQKINKKLFKFSLDCDKIVGVTCIRNRNNGDKYKPVNRNVTKSISRMLTEGKYSTQESNNLYVIEDEKGIIFTSYFGVDQRVAVDNNTKNIIVVEV